MKCLKHSLDLAINARSCIADLHQGNIKRPAYIKIILNLNLDIKRLH